MSMSLPVQAALISAATAAVVTLLVEYLAKPRLEARKDRIVTMAKLKRELEAQMLVLLRHPAFHVLRRQQLKNADIESIARVREQVDQLSKSLAAAVLTAEALLSLGFRDVRGRIIASVLGETYLETLNLAEDMAHTDMEALAQDDPDRVKLRKILYGIYVEISISLGYFDALWRLKFQFYSRAHKARRRRLGSELFDIDHSSNPFHKRST